MRVSLRWRIALVFIFAVLLTTAIATAFGVSQAQGEIRKSLVSRQEELAGASSRSIENFLDSSASSLGAAASLLQAGDLRPSINHARVESVLDAVIFTGQAFRPVYLVGSDGAVLMTRPPTVSAPPAGFADHPAFRVAAASLQPVPGLQAAFGPPSWVVPVPSTRSDSSPFFLVGVIVPDRMEEKLFTNLPPGTQAVVLDAGAGVLASTNPELTTRHFQSWPLSDRTRSTDIRTLEGPAPAGSGGVIATVRSMDPYAASVVMFTPVGQLVALQEPLIRSAVIVSVGLAAFSVLLGAFVARSITEPLTRVRRAVHRVATGDLSARVVPSGGPEIQELGHDFNRMARALERSKHAEDERRSIEIGSRMKSEFIANMSHEFRTPLNAILGFAELMRDGRAGPVSGQHKEYLGDILDSGNHLLRLVNDVLDISRIEAGRIDLKPEPVSPAEVLKEVQHALDGLASKKRIRVFGHVQPDLGKVVTDPGRLRQVLYNYMSNAIKFTDDRGWVLVRVVAHGDTGFRVEVIDNGVGISAKGQAQLFQEFQQLDTGLARRFPGSGLGLAVTRRLVESQGGFVGVLSRPGIGSVFYAVLPREPGLTVRKDVRPGPGWRDLASSFQAAGPSATTETLQLDAPARGRRPRKRGK